jgi:hypothetical protein
VSCISSHPISSYIWRLLILSSTYGEFGNLVGKFFAAVSRLNMHELTHVAGRFVLLVGRAISLRLAAMLLERAVSFLFSFSFLEHIGLVRAI